MLDAVGRVWDEHLHEHERGFVLVLGRGSQCFSGLPWSALDTKTKHHVARGMNAFCWIAQDMAAALIKDSMHTPEGRSQL